MNASTLLKQLSQAVAQGIALASLTVHAGCAETERSPNASKPPANEDASLPDGTVPKPTQTYPLDMLVCTGGDADADAGGPMRLGFHGPCCVEAHCYTPTSGGCTMASSVRSELPHFPPGSGTCTCGQTVGPFAPNANDTPVSEGECCYLVGTIGCDGRPLVIDGAVVVAAVIARVGWAPFA